MAESARTLTSRQTRPPRGGRGYRANGRAQVFNSMPIFPHSTHSEGATLGVNGRSHVDTGNGGSSARGKHPNEKENHGGRWAGQHYGSNLGAPRANLRRTNGVSMNLETKLSPAQIQDILENSLSGLTGSNSSRHATISQWATESGLAKIREIVESDFSRSYSVTRLMFDPHCVLFLRFLSCISQEEIQNSLDFEKALGTIYNVIYGPNGDRGVNFFRKVITFLVRLRLEKSENGKQYEEVLLHTTEAILSTLLQNQEATVKTEFRDVGEELGKCLYFEDPTDSAINSLIHQAEKNFLKIQDIFSTSDVSVHTAQTDSSGGKVKPTIIPAKVDCPGELSLYGPRHDNDHAAISKIKILPTLSEIWFSRRDDFLPTQDSLYSADKHHEEGIRRLLDTQFRLLREDTSGVLRDAVRLILTHWETIVHGSTWQEKRKVLRVKSPTPVRVYYGAQIKRMIPSQVKGVEIDVEFDQVHRAKNMTVPRRRVYWRESRALKEGGGILALIDAEVEENINLVFLQVSKRNIDPVSVEGVNVCVNDLVSNGKRAAITLRLTSSNSGDDLFSFVTLASRPCSLAERPLILVEFPALLYNSFEGVLRCLQTQYLDPRYIPFSSWIAPRRRSLHDPGTDYNHKVAKIPAPAYLLHRIIDLSSVPPSPNADPLATPLSLCASGDFSAVAETLSRRTMLDLGQAQAMVSALTNEIALIQGPPGTGKSYVGIQLAKCLLKNGLGPILCVCYTNHALDQFLQGLVNSGIQRIVRIGSRSTSPLLESLSLEEYKKSRDRLHNRANGRRATESRSRLGILASAIDNIRREIEIGSAGMIRNHLRYRFPDQQSQIAQEALTADDEGLDVWSRGDGPGDLNGNGAPRSIDQLLSVNVWTLTNQERGCLLKHWQDSAVKELALELQELIQQHALEKQHLTSLYLEKDAQIFHQIDVVGITTTGLANNAELLRKLSAKVLICEEAGEVLQSHFLATLLPSLEHAILIGDHLQLRPKISNKRLSKEYDLGGPKYNLDESIFERLATSHQLNASNEGVGNTIKAPEFPVAQLDCQRRMHPSIACLVRETLYPRLRDHPRTASYDGIPGMKHRLFWLDHRNMEDPSDPEDPMQSKTNTWEAEMVIALVKHIFKQGKYQPGEIAILTPYIGQLRLLKDKLEGIANLVIAEQDVAELEDSEVDERVSQNNGRNAQNRSIIGKEKLLDQLRLATVDNFQGDEATVVVVSLVRSNQYRNCGFLKTPNRINVLLSRAQHGMYIIGDANTASSAPMWASVIRMLEKSENIGPKLELDCSRHPDNNIYVSSSEDFLIKAPEGGCAERCGQRLPCGHTCTFKCHSNTLHGAVKCMALCTKMKKCGHSCPKRCHEKCGECLEKVPVCLRCEHVAEVECRRGGNLAAVKCTQIATKRIPRCGHDIQVPCHQDLKNVQCSHPCGAVRDCGHLCRDPCAKCPGSAQRHYGQCENICAKPFTTCAHSCPWTCHPSKPCVPCRKPCETRCNHSKCPKKCSDPCPPCAAKCRWSCIHRQDFCDLPCAVPCDMVPCDKRCEETLGCGHQCTGVCGEKCPGSNLCQTCGPVTVLERQVDFVTFQNYKDIDADKDPLIFLSCGHFYTRSTLDGIMELTDYYNIDPSTGTILGPKPLRRILTTKTPGCPECREPLRDIHRYNRIVKKTLLDESTKKFVVRSNGLYRGLIGDIQAWEMDVQSEKAGSLLNWSKSTERSGNSSDATFSVIAFRDKTKKLQQKIDRFIRSMAAVEQPYGRVNELLKVAISRQKSIKSDFLELNESAIQTGFEIRGQCLQLRLNWLIFWAYEVLYTSSVPDQSTRDQLREEVASRIGGILKKCRSVRDSSQAAKHLPQQVEAMIYHVLFSLMQLRGSKEKDDLLSDLDARQIRQRASEMINECEALLLQNPGQLGYLKDDIEKARRQLDGGVFYSFVTTEEKRQIYEAMATQFSGTGHWYYCRNNHPFTIGECGMPMEEARCPQCGEPVGGHDHISLPGVRRAEDIESEFAGA